MTWIRNIYYLCTCGCHAGRTRCYPLAVICPNLIYAIGHLQIFEAEYFFSVKHCHGRYRNHK